MKGARKTIVGPVLALFADLSDDEDEELTAEGKKEREEARERERERDKIRELRRRKIRAWGGLYCNGHPNPTCSNPALLPGGTLSPYHALSTKILNLLTQKSTTTSLKKARPPAATVAPTWIPASDEPLEHA